MQTIQSSIGTVIGAGVILFIMFWLSWYPQLPTVFKSWSTQECLYVKDHIGNKHDCGFESGKRYHLVWMK